MGVWNIFFDLNTCRPLGFGAVGPIPWDAFDRWCERHGIEVDLEDYIWELLRAMDSEFMDYMAKKRPT